MGSDKRYAINLAARYGPLEVVDLLSLGLTLPPELLAQATRVLA